MNTPPVGPPSRQDQIWLEVADLLTPAKSLERNDKAKEATTARITTTVTVVGTLLTGLGVLAAGQSTINGSARVLVAIAVAAAAIAVACVLAAQLTDRRKRMNINNLVEVRAWYDRQFDSGRYATLMGTVLVIAAAILAGAAAILSLSSMSAHPSITITQELVPNKVLSPVHNTQTISINVVVVFRGLSPGEVATVTVSEVRKVIASSAVTPTPNGTATSTLAVSGIPTSELVTINIEAARQHCRASIGLGNDHPVLTCTVGKAA